MKHQEISMAEIALKSSSVLCIPNFYNCKKLCFDSGECFEM